MPSAGVQTKFVAAEVVSLRDDPKFDERWLEKQIIERPTVLGLGTRFVEDRRRSWSDGLFA